MGFPAIYDVTGLYSDKIAKWQLLGWQGALLSSLLKEPLRFSSITCGALSDLNLPTHSASGPGGVASSQPDQSSHGGDHNASPVAEPPGLCHHGVPPASAGLRRVAETGGGRIPSGCVGTKEQEAAILRAVYERCMDSWQSIMRTWPHQGAGMARAPPAQLCEPPVHAQSLLKGWIKLEREVCSSMHTNLCTQSVHTNLCTLVYAH